MLLRAAGKEKQWLRQWQGRRAKGRLLNPLRGRHKSSRKSTTGEAGPPIATRFFLAKAESNGSNPALDRELPTEAEAMLESLKTGRNYYSVVEWRAVADCTGKAPQLKKELVSNSKR